MKRPKILLDCPFIGYLEQRGLDPVHWAREGSSRWAGPAGIPEIYRDYPRPPSLQSCARSILTVYRETLKQYITFKRGERGESVLLCSVVLQLWRPASTWWLGNMTGLLFPDPDHGILPIPDPRSRGQKGHRIQDPVPQHCIAALSNTFTVKALCLPWIANSKFLIFCCTNEADQLFLRKQYLSCGIVLGLLRELGLPVELVSANVELDPVVAQHLLLAPHPHAAQLKLHDKFILKFIKSEGNVVFRF